MNGRKRHAAGFSVIELFFLAVIILLLGLSSWMVYQRGVRSTAASHATPANVAMPSPSGSQTSSHNAAQPFASSPEATTGPYAGWKVYNSSTEHASFRYPVDWTFDAADAFQYDPSSSDYTALRSPDSQVVVSWLPIIAGFGDEHGQNYPYEEVVSVTPVPGAPGDVVTEGIRTWEGTKYFPWIAVQSTGYEGVFSSGVYGAPHLFWGRNNGSETAFFGTGGVYGNASGESNSSVLLPGMSEAAAKAYLTRPDMQQAKLILLSLRY